MKVTAPYLLMLQKYSKLKQKLWNRRLCTVFRNVLKDFTINNMKNQD